MNWIVRVRKRKLFYGCCNTCNSCISFLWNEKSSLSRQPKKCDDNIIAPATTTMVTRGQFHQHFMIIFCTIVLFLSLQNQNKLEISCTKHFRTKKFVHKMLMKFAEGVDFINILPAAFARADPESAKNWQLDCLFAILKYVCIITACRMLMKLTPDNVVVWHKRRKQ